MKRKTAVFMVSVLILSLALSIHQKVEVQSFVLQGAGDPFREEWRYVNYSHIRWATSVAISDDGRYIAVGEDQRRLYIFSTESSVPLWNYSFPTRPGTYIGVYVAVSSDGEYIIAGTEDAESYASRIYFFSRSNPEPLWKYFTENLVLSVDMSDDGQYVVVGMNDGRVTMFTRESSTPLWSRNIGGDKGARAVISADGQYVAAGTVFEQGESIDVYVFSRSSSTPLWMRSLGPKIWFGAQIAISADGEYILVSADDEKVWLFSRESSEPIRYYLHTHEMTEDITMSSDGRYVVTASAKGFYGGGERLNASVRLFSRDSQAPIWKYDVGNTTHSFRVSMSGDGRYIVVAADLLYVFSRDSSEPLWTMRIADRVDSMDISSEGQYIAAGDGHRIYLFKNMFMNTYVLNIQTSPIAEVSISYVGDYSGTGTTDFDIGPTASPFTVTLTAPLTFQDYKFAYWELDGTNMGESNTLSVTVDYSHKIRTAIAMYVSNISQTDDPTGDWFIGITGQPVQGHDFLDIVHSEVSIISPTEVHVKTVVNAPIPHGPTDGAWPAFRWFFDTDRNSNTGHVPSLFNDIGPDYYAQIGWNTAGFVSNVWRYSNPSGGVVVADITDYSIVGNTIEATFSLSSIGNPLSFDWVADSTDGIQVNDHAPNEGHMTLYCPIVAPVFPWRDDFNYNTLNEVKSAGWTFAYEPHVSVGGGVVTLDNDGSIGSWIYWAHFPSGVCDYRIEFSFMWIGRSYGSIRVVANTERHGYSWGGDGYYHNLEFNRDNYNERIGGYNPTKNTWMSFVFEKSDNTIKLYWNGNLIKTVTETDPTGCLKEVAIDCGWLSTHKIDYISVTSPTAPPSPPTLNSPANGATVSSTDVTFSWSSSSGATDYQIEINGPSSKLETVYSTSYTATLSPGFYTWRVRAHSSYGWSDWTATWRFTVTETLEVPYEHQGDAQWCGPASLAMVLRYYGIKVHVWDVAGDLRWGLGLPKGLGTTLLELNSYVNGRYPQFTTKIAKFSSFTEQIWSDIKSNITEGYPVILRVYDPVPYAIDPKHFVVVVGSNSTGLFVHDPAGTLFEWLWRKIPDSKISVYVNYTALERHVVTGKVGGWFDGTFLVIRGNPSPLSATLSIGFGSVWAQHEPSSTVYVDFDYGLCWKAKNHLLAFDSEDVLIISSYIFNHKIEEQTLSVRVSITGSWDNITYYPKPRSQEISVNPCYFRLVVFESLQVKTVLPKSQPYTISMELLESNGNKVDEFSIPSIFYSTVGSILQLVETQHKLYLHVYDKDGRHTGFNSKTNKTEVGVPNSFYYDNLNGTIVIGLPQETSQYKVVVDATSAAFASETYDITVINLENGKVIDQISLHSSIRKGEIEEKEIQISQEGTITVAQTKPWWEQYWYIILAFVLICGGASYMIIKRTVSRTTKNND